MIGIASNVEVASNKASAAVGCAAGEKQRRCAGLSLRTVEEGHK